MTDDDSGARLARLEDDQVAGFHSELDQINRHLVHASQSMNLIAPATRVNALPPGCGVSLAVLRVDTSVDQYGAGPDVYRVDGGKLALSRHVIDRIGAACGVSWDPVASARTDDRSSARYWSYRAVGTYRQYDGTPATIQNEYEWDVRDDSPRVEEMEEKATGNDYKTQKLKGNIRQMRKFGLQRAVTGARLRAMADIGFKRAYTPQELQRPFAIARLHFDGNTADPVLQHAFAVQTAAAMLGSAQMLYGDRPTPNALAADPSDEVTVGGDPPGECREVGEDVDDGPVYQLPGGPREGQSIHEAEERELSYWVDAADDEDLRSAIADEMRRRGMEPKL